MTTGIYYTTPCPTPRCLGYLGHEGTDHVYPLTNAEVKEMAADLLSRWRLVADLKGEDWIKDALCGGRYTAFMPERNSANRKNHPLLPAERKAKALCARCPVRRECLSYALKRNEDHGIWGGTLPSERKAGGLSRGKAEGRKARTDIDALLDEMTEQAVRLGLIEKEGVA